MQFVEYLRKKMKVYGLISQATLTEEITGLSVYLRALQITKLRVEKCGER